MKFRLLRKLSFPARENGVIMLRGREISFTVERSARRRRTVAFTVAPDKSLRVLAPARTRLPFIHAVLQNRSDWIFRKIAEHETVRQATLPQRFADGESVSYMGHGYRLCVTQDVVLPQGCRVTPRRFAVNIADGALSGDDLRQEVRLEILLWMKKRARIKFKKRMDLWAERLGVGYRKMLVTDPARQWGSCSVDNVVRLNWRLMMAPLPLIDYVVAHELAHVAHKNHSPRFWKFLAQQMPDYQLRRKKLRQIGAGLVL
jgi:predicted metal-dependent hydrolase